MFRAAFVTAGLVFLIITFLAFASPNRYVRIANLYFAKWGSDRRLQLKTYQRWSYLPGQQPRGVPYVLVPLLLVCLSDPPPLGFAPNVGDEITSPESWVYGRSLPRSIS